MTFCPIRNRGIFVEQTENHRSLPFFWGEEKEKGKRFEEKGMRHRATASLAFPFP
jgi:hypothetical protein